jgi:hypothetical protein
MWQNAGKPGFTGTRHDARGRLISVFKTGAFNHSATHPFNAIQKVGRSGANKPFCHSFGWRVVSSTSNNRQGRLRQIARRPARQYIIPAT